MTKEKEYDASSITVLKVSKLYANGRGCISAIPRVNGLHQLVYEVVDNSIDEALAGYCTEITSPCIKTDAVSVEDNGRGIPVGSHEKESSKARARCLRS